MKALIVIWAEPRSMQSQHWGTLIENAPFLNMYIKNHQANVEKAWTMHRAWRGPPPNETLKPKRFHWQTCNQSSTVTCTFPLLGKNPSIEDAPVALKDFAPHLRRMNARAQKITTGQHECSHLLTGAQCRIPLYCQTPRGGGKEKSEANGGLRHGSRLHVPSHPAKAGSARSFGNESVCQKK